MAAVDDVPEEKGLPESLQHGLNVATKYMVSKFLNAEHYGKISTSLSTKWDRLQSLSAATKLMEQHGVKLTPEEEERFASMNEMQMIDALVNKMPQQSKEQFQHFFLQLQLIVSTATRVRQALEEGKADAVEGAMEDADRTGIAQYILKMAIVQAGSEVQKLKAMHEAFVKDAELKMSRLVRGQEDAIHAKKKLAKAQSALVEFQTSNNERIKKVLMSFTSGSASAMVSAIFSSWRSYVKKAKQENEIYKEYRDRIEIAEQRLIDAKAQQLSSVRKMLTKKAQGFESQLLADAFGYFKEERENAIFERTAGAKVKELEEKLAKQSAQQMESARRVMARMGSASEAGLVTMCFQAIVQFHQDYLKDKEANDALKEAERKVQEFKKGKSQQTQGILNKMAASSDSGLVYECWSAWNNMYLEEKKSNEMAEILNSASSKLGVFGDRNKGSAKSVMERAAEHANTMTLLRHFNAWRLDSRVEKLLKQNQGKIDAKRQQLLQVQQMFRNFAVQLEAGIKSGADSDRDLAQGPPASFEHGKNRKQMTKGEGSVSLPEIRQNARPPSHASSGPGQ